jgi:carboxyl-terminal processing protease
MRQLYLNQSILKEKPMENQKFKKMGKLWAFIALQIGIVILSVAVGFFAHSTFLRYRGEFGLVRQAKDILQENTVSDIPDETILQYGMIRGLLHTLDDPYTYFVEPAEHEVHADELAGRFGGVGIELARDTDNNWRIYPLPDSPAAAAGIQSGDVLLMVDDLKINADTLEIELLSALRGEIDDPVSLTVLRAGKRITYSIKREAIDLPSVTWYLLPEKPQIGMIQINRIAETTAEEIKTGIETLQQEGAQAFMLDLRNNGGGLVDAGVEISRLFLTEGDILHKTLKQEDVTVLSVEEAGSLADTMIVVLINGNTASSAEIIAGALQNLQRANLIGSPSFGKTSIQFVFDLRDGSSIHVTSGFWSIPGQEFPLQPDVLIGEDQTEAETLQTAIEVLEKELE